MINLSDKVQRLKQCRTMTTFQVLDVQSQQDEHGHNYKVVRLLDLGSGKEYAWSCSRTRPDSVPAWESFAKAAKEDLANRNPTTSKGKILVKCRSHGDASKNWEWFHWEPAMKRVDTPIDDMISDMFGGVK